MRLPFHRLLIVPAVALAVTAAAQDGYQMPPDNIVRIAEAPPTPGISVSPDNAHVVLTHRESLIPLAELSRAELRIAGLRIDPAANAMSRRRMFRRLTLEALDGGAETAVTGLPDPLRGDHLSWRRTAPGSPSPTPGTTGWSCGRWMPAGARRPGSSPA